MERLRVSKACYELSARKAAPTARRRRRWRHLGLRRPRCAYVEGARGSGLWGLRRLGWTWWTSAARGVVRVGGGSEIGDSGDYGRGGNVG